VARKELTRIAKLEFKAGQARPGPALAGLGIDMAGFAKEFNAATKERGQDVVPVIIECYSDRSFKFVLKTTPASRMILKALKIDKGSQTAATKTIGTLTKEQALEIAQYKLEDLNAKTIEAALKIIVGTAQNMGIEVEGFKKAVKEEKEKMIINENYEQQIADMEAGIAAANEAASSDSDEEQEESTETNEEATNEEVAK